MVVLRFVFVLLLVVPLAVLILYIVDSLMNDLDYQKNMAEARLREKDPRRRYEYYRQKSRSYSPDPVHEERSGTRRVKASERPERRPADKRRTSHVSRKRKTSGRRRKKR